MPTQAQTNPYKNTDSNKRYFTYDYYLRKTFGGKCLKIPLDIGCTCPNIDGNRGKGGCIYCSSRGSGDFALAPTLSIEEQCKRGREALSKKWDTDRIIPYFQAHTNTYGEVAFLREKFTDALKLDNVVAMNIATRADCISDEILGLLCEIAEQTVLTVELGLQSTNDKTAELINRCHTYSEFLDGYRRLRAASDKIRIGVHIIDGLPGETKDDMIQTARDVAALCPNEVKIHLMHVITGTRLAKMYESGEYTPLELDDYARIVVEQLTMMPPDTVIGRVTGDGVQSDLLAPIWSLRKTNVINTIDKLMYAENLWQGKNYK